MNTESRYPAVLFPATNLPCKGPAKLSDESLNPLPADLTMIILFCATVFSISSNTSNSTPASVPLSFSSINGYPPFGVVGPKDALITAALVFPL